MEFKKGMPVIDVSSGDEYTDDAYFDGRGELIGMTGSVYSEDNRDGLVLINWNSGMGRDLWWVPKEAVRLVKIDPFTDPEYAGIWE